MYGNALFDDCTPLLLAFCGIYIPDIIKYSRHLGEQLSWPQIQKKPRLLRDAFGE